MKEGQKEILKVRIISVGFTLLALAAFKPFGLSAWQWQAYLHLLTLWVLGFGVCLITEGILKYIVKMPQTSERGVDYIIRRNLWFQLINTPLVAVMICLYRHFVLSERAGNNNLSWSNFFETLVILAFCSFAIGLYWRFKYRSRYLTIELEETRMLNEQLQKLHQDTDLRATAADLKNATAHIHATESPVITDSSQPTSSIVLSGTTSETVTLQIADLLYIEAVGNYVKIYHLQDGQVQNDMLRATSKQMENDLLAYPIIVRCHRAFLVNLGQVEKVVSKAGSMQLIMKHSHDSIPVSRSNMPQVKEAIKGF